MRGPWGADYRKSGNQLHKTSGRQTHIRKWKRNLSKNFCRSTVYSNATLGIALSVATRRTPRAGSFFGRFGFVWDWANDDLASTFLSYADPTPCRAADVFTNTRLVRSIHHCMCLCAETDYFHCTTTMLGDIWYLCILAFTFSLAESDVMSQLICLRKSWWRLRKSPRARPKADKYGITKKKS